MLFFDLEKTKHYTTKAGKICSNLIHYIPNEAKLIEPFVGGGDLLFLFPNHEWEKYDIEDVGDNIVQDTLKNPPSYCNKWVITNPPYLAKNKAADKSLFNQYGLDDLYKIFLMTCLDAEGGIAIIPTNFFTDERTGNVRAKFLDIFEIKELNIFTEPVFESTTYSVCSFAFQKRQEASTKQNCKVNIMPKNEQVNISLAQEYDYRIAGEFYNSLIAVENIFGRLVGKTSNDYITNIKLYALDTRTERIRVEYDENHYEGKNSDRTYATFVSKKKLTKEQERQLVDKFNQELENFRKTYYDLSMTNYRDYNRKRIGFTFAYSLLSKCYYELFG